MLVTEEAVIPTFERCRPEDAPLLTTIAIASKRHWGYPERYFEAWIDGLTIRPEVIREHEVWGARVGDDLAGFYMLIPCGRRADLEHLWVRPASIGTGLGRSLLEHAVGIARARRVSVIDITSDPNAEGFYQHMGAKNVGRVAAPVNSEARFLPRIVLEVRPSV
jgi:GNAT superfamily N-acetyltransferase